MAAVRHLGFVNFNFLKVREVKNPILHQRTKFRKHRSNRWGYIAIFVIFKMATVRHLDDYWMPLFRNSSKGRVNLNIAVRAQPMQGLGATVRVSVWRLGLFRRYG